MGKRATQIDRRFPGIRNMWQVVGDTGLFYVAETDEGWFGLHTLSAANGPSATNALGYYESYSEATEAMDRSD